MSEPDLGAIDWTAPWLAQLSCAGRAVAARVDIRAALNEAARHLGVRNAFGHPIRFVGPEAAGDAAYEAHIGRTGEVPTRANLHDFFNALVWLTLPRTKAALNELQARAIAAAGVGARRGAVRDAATLIDENAVLLVTRRADLVDALRRHDWHALFVASRDAWPGAIRAVPFGHALLEKLTSPYKAITAHALPVPLSADAPLAELDAWAAESLDASLSPARLLPLPVLGIPGWAANEAPSYYDDRAVFRPCRRRRDTPPLAASATNFSCPRGFA